jgi:hypothetical protein
MSAIQHVPTKVLHVIERQKAALEKIKEKGKEQLERATHSAIVGGVAYGLGYRVGRNGNDELIGKASASLVVAIAGHTAALVGPKDYGSFAAAVGDGGIAALAFQAGKEAGEKARGNGKQPILKAA